MGVRREVQQVVRESWGEVRDENITFMAGSIAYYAFVSMLPLLLFGLFVLSAVDSRALTAHLSTVTESVLTPHARQLLVESLDSTAARTGVSVVGAITLLWGTSRIFRGLDVAFEQIYDIKGRKGIVQRFVDGIVVAAGLAVAITAIVTAGMVFAVIPDLPYPAVVNPLLLVVGLSLAFYPIYYVFPDVDVTPYEVIPGTVVAAVGWAVLEAVFQGYVVIAGRYEAVYGTLGSAFLLLIWLYFSGLVLLVGGVVNAVLAGRTGDEHVVPLTDDESAAGPIEDRDSVARRDTGDPAAEGRGPTAERDVPGNGDAPGDGDGPRARRPATGARDDRGVAYAQSDSDAERLAAENDRLRERIAELEAENDRLKRGNADLRRRLKRRRQSTWERVKRMVRRRQK